MSNTAYNLEDWISFEQLAEKFPTYTLSTLNYLARAEVRRENGFGSCIRFITPRNVVVSQSKFAAWIAKRPQFGGRSA